MTDAAMRTCSRLKRAANEFRDFVAEIRRLPAGDVDACERALKAMFEDMDGLVEELEAFFNKEITDGGE